MRLVYPSGQRHFLSPRLSPGTLALLTLLDRLARTIFSRIGGLSSVLVDHGGRPAMALQPASAGGSVSRIRTAWNNRGVLRSTVSRGSGTVRKRSTASLKYGLSRGSPRRPAIARRSPPSITASSLPSYGPNTAAAAPAAAASASLACFSRRRAKRCCEVPPAALRPCTSREPTLDAASCGPGPANTPAA